MISDHFKVSESIIVDIIETVALVPQPPDPSAVIFKDVKASVTVRVPKAESLDINANTASDSQPPSVSDAKKFKAAILSLKFNAFQPLYPCIKLTTAGAVHFLPAKSYINAKPAIASLNGTLDHKEVFPTNDTNAGDSQPASSPKNPIAAMISVILPILYHSS